MIVLKQLKFVNIYGTRPFSGTLYQSTKSTHHRVSLPCLSDTSCNTLSNNGSNILRINSTNLTTIRHHYRNYQHHPLRIVRAYRKTRTWLTDHFVIAENRFENIYSFTFLVIVGLACLLTMWVNPKLGGEAGDFDRNKLAPKTPSNASK